MDVLRAAIVGGLQMTAFSHGCIMESAKVHSNLVLKVKERASVRLRLRGDERARLTTTPIVSF